MVGRARLRLKRVNALGLGVLLLPAAALAFPAQDVAAELASKEVAQRLQALRKFEQEPTAEAAPAVLQALEDDDWEVVEQAARSVGRCAEAFDSEDACAALLEVALEIPPDRCARVAAESLASVDAERAFGLLAKKLRSKTLLRATMALTPVVRELGSGDAAKRLDKVLGEDDPLVREAAAVALAAGLTEKEEGAFARLLESGDALMVASALGSARVRADAATARVAITALAQQDSDVLERRLLALCAESILRLEQDEEAGSVLRELCATLEQTPSPPGRNSRLARRLLIECQERGLDTETLIHLVEQDLSQPEVHARLAAVAALGVSNDPAHAQVLAKTAGNDDDARARRAALAAWLARPDVEHSERIEVLERVLTKDPERLVREEAAVALGVRGEEAAVRPLIRALADADWKVAAAAAVSLGRTGSDQALEPLSALAGAEDWRLRGAAVVGLSKIWSSSAVPALIAALEDAEPLVGQTAFEALARLAKGRDVEPTRAAWNAWWEENSAKVRYETPGELDQRRSRYGYSIPDQEIYDELDVIVLESRGDHIENVLTDLGIDHRRTTATRLKEIGLHPAAIFFSNCTGEIEPEDVERLEWFVHTGGALFGSCWALSETIERIEPGVVRKLETTGEVLRDVRAWPCVESSPYLVGVFPEAMRPVYHLEGSHVIEVLDPSRAQVLIDSPECASQFGGGNLAAWFRLGHGVIFDAANHFDLQGLETISHLKKPEERQAWALDHMGLSWEQWRATRNEKYWSNALKASREIHDRSAFRFVTNFVRLQRQKD